MPLNKVAYIYIEPFIRAFFDQIRFGAVDSFDLAEAICCVANSGWQNFLT